MSGIHPDLPSLNPVVSPLQHSCPLRLEQAVKNKDSRVPGPLPAQCVGGVLSEGCLSRGGVTQLLKLNSLCKFEEMAYEFKELT